VGLDIYSNIYSSSHKNMKTDGFPLAVKPVSSTGHKILRPRPIGKMRPNIILYNEVHPQGEEISQIVKYDLGKKPDMLIVLGTTISIQNLKEYVGRRPGALEGGGRAERRGRLGPGEDVFDYVALEDVDERATKAACRWKETNPGDWDDHRKATPRVLARYEIVELEPPV
jgi:NAD+-dependent protein deacetylase SIR2